MLRIIAMLLATVFLRSAAFAQGALPSPSSCEHLAQAAIPGAKITAAQNVAAGAFVPPASSTPWIEGSNSLFKSLPAFCRVSVTATPSADSDIRIEVWLPASGWNGRFRGQGN